MERFESLFMLSDRCPSFSTSLWSSTMGTHQKARNKFCPHTFLPTITVVKERCGCPHTFFPTITVVERYETL
jgi:hypothetical protein